MATTFNEIYCLNSTIMNDNRLKQIAPDRFYQILSYYLQFSRAFFGDWCFRDIDTATEYTREEYTFTGDGSTTDFVLSPAPPTGAVLYVTEQGLETKFYTYTELTNTISYEIAPPMGHPITIVAYIVGEFAVTLNNKEKMILAEGMVVPFVEYQINRTKSLDQISFTKDMVAFSQANHNKVSLEVDKNRYARLWQMINDYEYGSFADNDNLSGLAGASTYE